MTVIAFNKLAYMEHLKTAGVDDAHARAHARAHAFALDDALKDSVATKADIRELEAKMRELELWMTVKFGGMLFVAVGVILTAIRFMLTKSL
jgi:hypothetical protein